MDCLFCKIANGEIPADVVYEDDYIIAFRDIEPQAPVHVLVIPRKHIATIDELTTSAEDKELLGHLLTNVHIIAEKAGITNGYRLVVNTGEDAIQSVQHIHFHILGGRKFGWPPG